jgi:phospholipid/cholesterol/gamma-HCH transport system substrate-binding protein
MKESIESKLGIFFALAVVLVLLILEYLGSFGFLERGYHIHALFKNVQDLKIGDSVKMAGVHVGRVQNIILTNAAAEVLMNLNRDAEVKTDSKASISFTGLMSQNYVAIDFGTPDAPKVEDNAILETAEQPDLSQIFTKLDHVASGVENLTKSFSGEKIDNILGPLTDFMKDNRTNLTATISNIKTTSDKIASGQGTIGKLINDDTLYVSAQGAISNLQGVGAYVQGVTSDAHTLLTNANQIVTDVRGGKGTVGKLITDDTLYVAAAGTMTNFHAITLKINEGQGTVGQLINDDSFLKGAKLSLEKLDKATESLEDTGPLSILGTIVTSLF